MHTQPTTQTPYTITYTQKNICLSGDISTFDIPQLLIELKPLAKKTNIINIQNLKNADGNVFYAIRKLFNKKVKYEHISEHFIDMIQSLPTDLQFPKPQFTPTHYMLDKFKIIKTALRLFKVAFLYKNKFNQTQKALVFTNFCSNVNQIGIKSLPVFTLMMFFLGLVIMFQSTHQMSQFAAELYAVDFLTISIFRELGPILTGIILASRTGSAIAAQLGTMKNNEEIAMLETMGLSPIKLIILPKLLALVFISPFLTFFSCIVSILGGLLIFTLYLGQSIQLFWNIFYACFSNASFWMFAWKGPLFALVVGLIASAQGMSVKSGSIDLSQKTTNSVVASLIAILLIDGLISIITTYIR